MGFCKSDRFDFTISNPPYDGVLHLKVLDTMLALSRRAVFLHPARWVHETQLNSALGLPAKDPMPSRLSGMLEHGDYTHVWTDAELCAHFGLDGRRHFRT